MHATPPRRSRRPPDDGERSMPFIPIFIGVIVLGLVIGAALSLLAKRNDSQVAVRTSTPQPTLAPVTPAPTEKPTAEPTMSVEKAAPAPTLAPESPTAVVEGKPSPKATRAKPALLSATVAPASSSPARATPHTVALAPQPALTVRPRPAANAPAPAAAARATDAPAGADDADSDFAKLAAGVVRQYIAAVARGDVPGAYGALGQNVPDTVDLPEIGVIDGNTRIRHVEARGANDAAAVNVDMQGRNGLFFGQFTVHKTSSGAAVIVAHSVVKP